MASFKVSSSFEVSIRVPFEYSALGCQADNSELILLLHGFRDNNTQVLARLENLQKTLSPGSLILAPNAPYPFRTKNTEGGFELEYSWYFFDPDQRKYLRSQAAALDYLYEGLARLNLLDHPKRIIGYSQGGFIAPFVGQKLPNTKQVIGIACEYYTKDMEGAFPFPIDSIHGDQDRVVSFEVGRESHGRLRAMGFAGGFHPIAGTGHEINTAVENKIIELIERRRRSE